MVDLVKDGISLVIYKSGDEAVADLQPWIRRECERRILELMPAWKQRNVIADLSSSDADKKAAAVTDWSAVELLRTKSNELEEAVKNMSDEEHKMLNIEDDSHWKQWTNGIKTPVFINSKKTGVQNGSSKFKG